MLGVANLTDLLATLRQALPLSPIGIQTNGLLISNEILDICAERGVTLSVSLDGPRHVHDSNRRDFAGRGTFDGVVQGVRRLQAHPHAASLFSGLLAVVDPTSRPAEVYGFFKDLGAPGIDFIGMFNSLG